MGKRLEYVDIAKGIGLILVVCSHSDAFDLMWYMMDMCIPIFFFCSGYTFKIKETFRDAMAKKFRRLFMPYLFFNMVLLFVFFHFSLRELIGIIYSRFSLYPLDVTPNIKFFTSGNYPMWFLTSMIMSYFLFYLLVYYEKYKHALMLLYALLVVCFMKSPILLPWSIDTAPLTAMLIYVGMKIRKHDLISMDAYQVLFLVLLYIGLRCVGGELNISVREYGSSIAIYFLLAIIASIVVLWGSKFLEGTFVGRCFFTLGKHSLTIFSVEIAFIVLAKDIYRWIFPGSELGYMAGIFEIFLTLLGGLFVSILIHKSKFLSRVVDGS
ncbi:acyltransferase family protein [Xylanibacter ruminicola]|uniref:acyltransferase family protein n=1 Tax=Xylanibacter ruminicola TaxID=839 RepID=UPI00048A66C6|nr:acyltransferase family protein [Xylanibacter ruminicola]